MIGKKVGRIGVQFATLFVLGALLTAPLACAARNGVAGGGSAEQAVRTLDQAADETGREPSEVAEEMTNDSGEVAPQTDDTIPRSIDGADEILRAESVNVGARVERTGREIRE